MWIKTPRCEYKHPFVIKYSHLFTKVWITFTLFHKSVNKYSHLFTKVWIKTPFCEYCFLSARGRFGADRVGARLGARSGPTVSARGRRTNKMLQLIFENETDDGSVSYWINGYMWTLSMSQMWSHFHSRSNGTRKLKSNFFRFREKNEKPSIWTSVGLRWGWDHPVDLSHILM